MRGDDHCRGGISCNLLGVAGSGKDSEAVEWKLLPEDLAHGEAGANLHALGAREHECRIGHLAFADAPSGFAHGFGGGHDEEEVTIAEVMQVVLEGDVLRDGDAGEVDPVFSASCDFAEH